MKKAASGTDIEKIRKQLGHLSLVAPPTCWLNTQIPELNEVFGDPELGVPYSRIIEIFGWESQGKSAIAYALGALAQQDEAEVHLADFEISITPDPENLGKAHPDSWVAKRGLDVTRLHLYQPYVGTFGKEKSPRLCSAGELCAEIEAGMTACYKRGAKKQLLIIDSVSAMMPEGLAEAGIESRSMKDRMELAVFMNGLLNRWIGLAQAYNCTIIFINQLRQKPGKVFGDPSYTTGGNALKFYAHVRVRTKRGAGSLLRKKGKAVGIQGLIINKKNKCGGLEQSRVGFRMYFRGPIEFVDPKEIDSKNESSDE